MKSFQILGSKLKKPRKQFKSELVVTRIYKEKPDKVAKRFHTNQPPNEIDLLDDWFYE